VIAVNDELSSSATALALLDRRAFLGAVATEYAAVALKRLQYRSAVLAVIEILASVGRHRLGALATALRTSEGALQ
jgi:hypothetical protein